MRAFLSKIVLGLLLILPAFGISTDNPSRKRVLIPALHLRVIDSLAKVLEEIGGYEVCLLSKACSSHKELLSGGSPWPFHKYSWKEITQRGVSRDRKISLLDDFKTLLDSPPDIIIIAGPAVEWHSDHNLYEQVWPEAIRSGRTKIVYYSGLWRDYPPKRIHNYLCADGNIYRRNFIAPYSHVCAWIPWVDGSGLFQFRGPSDSSKLGSYITDFSRFSGFAPGYKMFQEISNELDGISWGGSCELEFYDNILFTEIPNRMSETFATLHIKSRPEGYGYAVMESLLLGKPIFFYIPAGERSDKKRRKCLNWCIEGTTAFFFSSKEEFYEKLRPFLLDKELRVNAQIKCAAAIREMIDFDAERDNLKAFLENLLPQYND